MTSHATAPGKLTRYILIAMVLGAVVGLLQRYFFAESVWAHAISHYFFAIPGQIFIRIVKMLVIPIVTVSLICGSFSIGDGKRLGAIGLKALVLYLLTTALAIILGLFFAHLFHVGQGTVMTTSTVFEPKPSQSVEQVILNMFPINPIHSLSEGNMLQIVLFSILFGVAIAKFGNKTAVVKSFFLQINDVLLYLIILVMKLAPAGVFCLLAVLFSKIGFSLIKQLASYFAVVLFVLTIQLVGVYSLLLIFLARINPLKFLNKMRNAMLFAFSISSSSASIPIVMQTVENRLGVSNTIASFIIPLGATVNMDGTAIMQGVATVFIAHVYHITLGIHAYAMVVVMATLASIGTAGVPGVGLITLAMVLGQVGLPVQGIALIIGVDRLLDMVRTAVNISGDATVSCIVAQSEKMLDRNIYNSD